MVKNVKMKVQWKSYLGLHMRWTYEKQSFNHTFMVTILTFLTIPHERNLRHTSMKTTLKRYFSAIAKFSKRLRGSAAGWQPDSKEKTNTNGSS